MDSKLLFRGTSEQLDEEHLKIFDMVAKIEVTLEKEEAPVSTAMELINELKQYALRHFAHEEAYMERILDPELGRQKLEHAAFTRKVNSYKLSEITEHNSREICEELLKFLSKWLMGHIMGSDILIGHFKQPEESLVPEFDDRYKTGIPSIDDEHNILFELIKKIHVAIQNDFVHDKFELIHDLIDELEEYAHVHFTNEENYMREIGYDGLEEQEIMHQKFLKKFENIELENIKGNEDIYLYEFLGIIQDWLVNHILKADKLIPQPAVQSENLN